MDIHHTIDAKNKEDIAKVNIHPDESVYIPYKWYYYLIKENPNLFFEGSGIYPKNLSKLIISTQSEYEHWNSMLYIEQIEQVSNYKVFVVKGQKNPYILKELPKNY